MKTVIFPSPYLDNRVTSGETHNSPPFQMAQRNKKRAYAVGNYRRKNIGLARELEAGLQARPDYPSESAEIVLKFIQSIRGCASHSLFREYNTGEMTYIGSHTCGNKLCHVCNSQRKRKIRRMYYKYFEANPHLTRDYDFMHLTLTVPHTEDGWKDEKIYIQPLLYQFSEMRKKKFWKKQVYAGEYTVEFTRNHNGLHIHIHALLLVEKGEQNRNRLYREIFRNWNMQTTWEGAKRKEFTNKQRLAIARALSMNPRSNAFKDFFKGLKPTGSTLCSLESLYIMKDGKKKYVSAENEKDFMAGIMECLKYHFEPCKLKRDPNTGEKYNGGIFNKDDGEFNIDLLLEVLPAIRNQRLYAKIGKFYGDARLNMNQTDNLGKLIKTTKEQFIPEHTFKIEGYDKHVSASDSQRVFEQELEKRKVDDPDYDNIIEEFVQETEYGEMPKWEKLNKSAFSKLKRGFQEYLTEKYPDKHKLNRKVVSAFSACFYQDFFFQGILALRHDLKALFGDYYIPYAAMIVEILKENRIIGPSDVSERPHPCQIGHKIREALKARLEALEKEEEARDNSASEGAVNPETLIPALVTDYCYKIRDIATVFIPMNPKTDPDDPPTYGKMRFQGDPRYDIAFYGKLDRVMKRFSEFIQTQLRDTAQVNRLKRNVQQAKRIAPHAA